jgi:hypothetical protein
MLQKANSKLRYLWKELPMNADETLHPGFQTEAPAEETAEATCCAEAVRRAKAELQKAQQMYEDVRRRAAEKVEAVRKTTVGDVLDTTLNAIRKYPGKGLMAAAVAGFLLGRLFKR